MFLTCAEVAELPLLASCVWFRPQTRRALPLLERTHAVHVGAGLLRLAAQIDGLVQPLPRLGRA
jgi:hypothetical protein